MPYEATWLYNKDGKVIAPKTLVEELENDVEHPEEVPDIAGTKITFESNDVDTATEYTEIGLMTSGETNAELFSKISTTVKNVRFLNRYSKTLNQDLGQYKNTLDNTVLNLDNHLKNKANPHGVTKKQVGLEFADNTSDANKPVSTLQKQAIDKALEDAKTHTNTEISNLIGGAPETLNTLKEISDAMTEHQDVVDAINEAIGLKLDTDIFNTHANNGDIHFSAAERTKLNTAYDHSQTGHARTDATKTEKSATNGNVKINGTETVVYSHPSSHAATMITQDATHRFITDDERTGWNNKSDSGHTHLYAGSTSAGGPAKSVAQALTVQLNGTTQWTYNGSTARTLNITPGGIGAAPSSHSHNYAGSDSAGGPAKSVAQSFIIKLNSGTTEGTNMFTYNGSAAKSLNITPGGIGAATSGHTHLYAGSASAGGPAKSVAQSLTIQLNGGTTEGTNKFTFNGSAAKSFNITPDSIGAAPTHDHPYASSSHNHSGVYAPVSHSHSYLPLSGGTVTGVTSFMNTTASTSKTTGAVKVSGGMGVAGRMSANEVMIGDKCTLKYSDDAVSFVFS